jgi:Fe2+ transport system protein B
VAEQASVLNPEQRQQVVDQTAKNVQKLVDSCGGDKELLKTTLTQRIKNLLRHPVAGPVVMTLFTCAEVALYIVIMCELIQDINFVAAITLGKQVLIPNWFSLQKFDHWGPVLCLRIGVILGWYVGL